jgi:hypothetical protein
MYCPIGARSIGWKYLKSVPERLDFAREPLGFGWPGPDCLDALARDPGAQVGVALPREPLLGPVDAQPVLTAAFGASGDADAIGMSTAEDEVDEGGAMATQGSTTVFSAPAAAACSQAMVSTRARPSIAAAVVTTCSRSMVRGKSGKSIPVTRLVRRRNGDEDGHAPMQIPQATQRSVLTATCCANGAPSVRGTRSIAE